jgi:hypothetical protein
MEEKVDLGEVLKAFEGHIVASEDGKFWVHLEVLRVSRPKTGKPNPVWDGYIDNLREKNLLKLLPSNIYVAESDDAPRGVNAPYSAPQKKEKKEIKKRGESEGTRTPAGKSLKRDADIEKLTLEEIDMSLKKKEAKKYKELIENYSVNVVVQRLCSVQELVYLAYFYKAEFYDQVRREVEDQYGAECVEDWFKAIEKVERYIERKEQGDFGGKDEIEEVQRSSYTYDGVMAVCSMTPKESWSKRVILEKLEMVGVDWIFVIKKHVLKIRPDLEKAIEEIIGNRKEDRDKQGGNDFNLGNFLTNAG